MEAEATGGSSVELQSPWGTLWMFSLLLAGIIAIFGHPFVWRVQQMLERQSEEHPGQKPLAQASPPPPAEPEPRKSSNKSPELKDQHDVKTSASHAGLSAETPTAQLAGQSPVTIEDVTSDSNAAEVAPDTDHTATDTDAAEAAPGTDHTATDTDAAEAAPGTDHTATDTDAAEAAPGTDHTATDTDAVETAPDTDHTATDTDAVETAPDTDHTATDTDAVETAPGTDHTATDTDAVETASDTDHTATDTDAAEAAPDTDHTATDTDAAEAAPDTDHTATDTDAAEAAPGTDHTATDTDDAGAESLLDDAFADVLGEDEGGDTPDTEAGQEVPAWMAHAVSSAGLAAPGGGQLPPVPPSLATALAGMPEAEARHWAAIMRADEGKPPAMQPSFSASYEKLRGGAPVALGSVLSAVATASEGQQGGTSVRPSGTESSLLPALVGDTPSTVQKKDLPGRVASGLILATLLGGGHVQQDGSPLLPKGTAQAGMQGRLAASLPRDLATSLTASHLGSKLPQLAQAHPDFNVLDPGMGQRYPALMRLMQRGK